MCKIQGNKLQIFEPYNPVNFSLFYFEILYYFVVAAKIWIQENVHIGIALQTFSTHFKEKVHSFAEMVMNAFEI